MDEKEKTLRAEEEKIGALELRNKLLHDALEISNEKSSALEEKINLQKYINRKLIARNQELFALKESQQKRLNKKNRKIRSLKSNIGY